MMLNYLFRKLKMPLSREMQQKSLEGIIGYYYDKEINLTAEESELLTKVNKLAADDNTLLSGQTSAILDELLESIRGAIKPTVAEMYDVIKQRLNENTLENQARHRAQGHFDVTPLHVRAPMDELQDHDMTRFMPKSFGNIVVLAVTNQNEYNNVTKKLAVEGIRAALNDDNKKHIILPMGPGHYRLMCITKPVPGEQYKVDLFGPYGEEDGRALTGLALELLTASGIVASQIAQPNLEGPTHKQPDGYACGDYTCAHAHEKMKAFGAPASAYDERLIFALNKQGNHDNALRNVFRAISANSDYVIPDTVLNVEPVIPDKPVSPAQVQPKPEATAASEAKKPETGISLDAQEQHVFEINFVKTANPTEASSNYKQELMNLISSRNTLFHKAEGLKGKSDLSDEELAITLQAEELRKAFK